MIRRLEEMGDLRSSVWSVYGKGDGDSITVSEPCCGEKQKGARGIEWEKANQGPTPVLKTGEKRYSCLQWLPIRVGNGKISIF